MGAIPVQSGDTLPPSAAAEGRASGSRRGPGVMPAAPKAPKPPAPKAPFLSLYSNIDVWDTVALAIGAAAALVNGATPPAFAFIFGEFVGALTAVDTLDRAKLAALHMCVLGGATLVATFLEVGLFKWSGARQVARLRGAYMHALLHLDMTFHGGATTKPEETVCALDRDCAAIEAAISHRVAKTLRTISTFVLAAALAFTRNWEVAMVALALAPVVGAATALVARAAQRGAEEARSGYAAAGALAAQAICHARAVVALQAERRLLERFVDMVAAPWRLFAWGPAATAAAHGAVASAEIVTYGLLLWYAAKRVRDGACTPEAAVQAAWCVVIAGMALGQAVPDVAQVDEGRRAGARLQAVLARAPPSGALDAGAALQKPLLGQVELQEVTFAFPSRPASPVLRAFTLHMAAGHVTALVGPTGCGKSTLLQLLSRLYEPTGGRICVDGMDVRSLSLRWYRTQVAMVSGDPVIFATSIRDNIAIGRPGASESEIHEAARAAGAAAFVQKLPDGYWTRVGGSNMQLTAEQKQRLAVARVALRDPRLLLLDEATSALDAENERAVRSLQAVLERLSEGRTTLVVTDQLASIRNAHQIAVMQKGRIVEYGSHSELYSQQQSLYHTLMRGHEASSAASAPGPEITPAAEARPSHIAKPPAATPLDADATPQIGPDAVSCSVLAGGGAAAGGGLRNGYAAAPPSGVHPGAVAPAAAAAAPPPAAVVPAAPASGAGTGESTTDGGDRGSDMTRVRLGGHMGVLGPGMHRARRALRMQLALGQYSAQGGGDVLAARAELPAIQWWAKQGVMGSGNLLCGFWPLPVDHSQPKECVLSCGLLPRMLRVDDPGHLTADEENVAVGPRRLLALTAPEWLWLVMGTAVSALLGAVRPLFAVLLAASLSLMQPGSSPSDGGRVVIFFVALAALQLVLSAAQAITLDIAGARLAERVRVLFLRAALNMEVAWFDQDANAGSILAAHLAAAAPAVRGAAGDTLASAAQAGVALALGLAVALAVSWKMTLVLSAAQLLLGFAVYVKEVCTGTDSANDDPLSDANETSFEALAAIRTVHIFGMQPLTAAAISAATARPHAQLRRAALAAGLMCGVSQAVTCGVFALSFWYGATLITSGHLSMRSLLIVMFALLLSALAAVDVRFTFPDVAAGATAVARVFRVIDRASKIDASRPHGFRPPGDVHGEVEFRDVTLAYPTRAAGPMLRRFSLVAPGRAVTALIGERVSGTVAAVGLVERFYDVHAGAVLLDGADVRDLDITWLRAQVGFLGPEPALFNGTILDNVQLGKPDATLEEVLAACEAANAREFIEGLPDTVDTVLGDGAAITLSASQRQRLAVARTILRDPRVLLLDEAAAMQDAESERVVQAAYERLMHGRTTIVIPRRLVTVRKADKIVVMQRGAVLAEGAHAELMRGNAKGQYVRLALAQCAN